MDSPSTQTTPRRIRMTPCFGVDVFAAQLGQLAEPQTAPGGEQHHQPVPLGHGVNDRRQLLEGGGLGLVTRLACPAPRIWHGFATRMSSLTAEAQMVRSS